MPPRTGVIASTSSKKMMHGAAVFAFRNVSRTIRSDSPTHLLMNSGPRTEMKFASDSVETADVLPSHIGLFDQDLPQRGRLHLPVGLEEIVPRNGEPVQDLGWDHIGLEIDVGQDAPQGPHGGLLREGREIGADISMGEARELL